MSCPKGVRAKGIPRGHGCQGRVTRPRILGIPTIKFLTNIPRSVKTRRDSEREKDSENRRKTERDRGKEKKSVTGGKDGRQETDLADTQRGIMKKET